MPDPHAPEARRDPKDAPGGPALSEREAAVLALVVDGNRIPGIAVRFDVAPASAAAALRRARDKTGGSAQHTILDRACRSGRLPAPTTRTPLPDFLSSMIPLPLLPHRVRLGEWVRMDGRPWRIADMWATADWGGRIFRLEGRRRPLRVAADETVTVYCAPFTSAAQ